MDSDHVLVLFLALVLVGTAVGIGLTSPSLFGGDDGDGPESVTDADLAAFETTGPVCGDPNTTSLSAVSNDAPAGETLVLTQTLPVPSNDTTVSATLNEFGPQRFLLEIESETAERTATPTPTATPTSTVTPSPTGANGTATDAPNGTAGNATVTTTESSTANATDAGGTAAATATTEPAENRTTATPTPAASDCFPAIQYNATIEIDQPGDYTVVVTYDGELVAARWGEGEDRGTYDRLPELPETEEAATENATATNATPTNASSVRPAF